MGYGFYTVLAVALSKRKTIRQIRDSDIAMCKVEAFKIGHDWRIFTMIEEVATLLNVHRQTVVRTIKRGKLRAIKPKGEALQVIRQDLLEYLNSVSNLR